MSFKRQQQLPQKQRSKLQGIKTVITTINISIIILLVTVIFIIIIILLRPYYIIVKYFK